MALILQHRTLAVSLWNLPGRFTYMQTSIYFQTWPAQPWHRIRQAADYFTQGSDHGNQ